MKKKWEACFDPDVYALGFEDFQQGQVTGLKKVPSGFEAYVADDKLETVRVHTEQGRILDIRCSCSTAQTDVRCRHSVATLLTLDEMLPTPLFFSEPDIDETVKVCLTLSHSVYRTWQGIARQKGVSVEVMLAQKLEESTKS